MCSGDIVLDTLQESAQSVEYPFSLEVWWFDFALLEKILLLGSGDACSENSFCEFSGSHKWLAKTRKSICFDRIFILRIVLGRPTKAF